MEGSGTGVLLNSLKGKNVSVEMRIAFSGKQMNSVREETPAISATEIIVDNQQNRLLLLQERRHKTTEEDFRKVLCIVQKVERRACTTC